MKILLTDIVEKEEPFLCEMVFDFSDDTFALKTPVEARLLVSQQSEKQFTLAGNLRAELVFACDRCGKQMQVDLARGFEYILRIEEEPEHSTDYQCSDEDCETLFLNDESIEIKEILAEQLLLAVPVQRLCDEACKGLCQECGVNLNKKKCQCGETNTNSPFAILKTLQQK